MSRGIAWVAMAVALFAGGFCAAEAPFSVSDYDSGDVYWVVDGQKHPYHGMREAWVFNRAMVWLGAKEGVEGAVICYSAQSPLLLTGKNGVSRWYAGKGHDVIDLDGQVTRFAMKDVKAEWDHVSLPPVQFHIEQNPRAELDVRAASLPWQLLVVVKGRSGPPLYASEWQQGPAKESVDLRDLYRKKGYTNQYAEMHFAVAVKSERPAEQAAVDFRLALAGEAAVVSSLPVIRTKGGDVPVYAVALDEKANRLGADAVTVTANVGNIDVLMRDIGAGVWKGVVRGLPVGEHKAQVNATWKAGGKSATTTLDIRITDGQFIAYDPKLRLLTLGGKPLGPLTGSYRGAPMFQHVGTDREALVQGQAQWDAVKGDKHEGQYFNHGGPEYTFHFWEALTDRELDADYGYLARCGWTMVHLCQGWWVWERLDAGGRVAPHGAEQLAKVIAAAQRHGLRIHLALSHYPLGEKSKPYAQYLEAGYQRGDYEKTDSAFYRMFKSYLADVVTLFGQDSGISSFTSAGEGDVACGKTFVNEVHAFMTTHDRNHLFLCEPHLNPKPYPSDANAYRKEGWVPLVGGMRTYMIDNQPVEHVAVQFKIGAMGHVFLGEGVFWGFMNGPTQMEKYRQRVRCEFYTGLAYRSPIQLSWEERVVEDERIVFEKVRGIVDWSAPFRRPGLVLRIGTDLNVLAQYERALSRMGVEYSFILKDDPVPAGAVYVLDTAEPFVAPAFVLDGGKLPDVLRAEIPLAFPKGYAANYSWSEDRRCLLAFIRDADGNGGASSDQDVQIRFHNLPDEDLRVRVYDLESKRVVAEKHVRKSDALSISGRPGYLFVVVNRGA